MIVYTQNANQGKEYIEIKTMAGVHSVNGSKTSKKRKCFGTHNFKRVSNDMNFYLSCLLAPPDMMCTVSVSFICWHTIPKQFVVVVVFNVKVQHGKTAQKYSHAIALPVEQSWSYTQIYNMIGLS